MTTTRQAVEQLEAVLNAHEGTNEEWDAALFAAYDAALDAGDDAVAEALETIPTSEDMESPDVAQRVRVQLTNILEGVAA